MDTTERSVSLWKATTTPLRFTPLAGDTHADVCVIGGGIAGITSAYLLAREGRSVVVLERTAIGGGETGQTTAHLASAMDDYYHEIERMHGEAGARIAYASHQAAIERIETIVGEERIACDLIRNDGYLFLQPGEDAAVLDRELIAARKAGFSDVERLDRLPLEFWTSGPCLRFPRQGQFHPLHYLQGLVGAAARLGVRIHTGTEVVESPAGGTSVRVKAGSGTVTAGSCVVATNYPITRWLGIVPKLAPYRTYVVGLRVPANAVPAALYWDVGDPYHYIRTAAGDRPGEELLIVGGEDHKTGQQTDMTERLDRLVGWARERFPMAGDVTYRWSGQVQEPVDAMGYIGAHPGEENVYVITGDSGQGMTHGTLGAMLVTDLISGRSNSWAELYDPGRSGLADPVELARENLNAATQFADYLAPGEVRETSEIPAGQGAIVRRGTKQVAIYRDEAGVLHERSAACTHLGCVVHWNSFEKSWDCPCHGSRFDPTGKVLTAPASSPLSAPGD